MKRIPLTRGKFALVDDADFEWLNKYKWSARKLRNSWYAQRGDYKNRKHDIAVMHREILGLKKHDGLFVDHKNGDGLDNQRHNLRICNNQQNHFNMRTTTGTSKYKGVCFVSRLQRKKWLAQIMCGGRHYFLGHFFLEEDAAMAYDKKAIELFGKYACLNFPNQEGGI